MFYVLMILPHVVVMAGLVAFAYWDSKPSEPEDTGWYWTDGGPPDPEPEGPRPRRPGGGLPLPNAAAPRRRLRPHERLTELFPRPVRRGAEPREPRHLPSRG